ncbi:MAG: cytochrome c3 family protein [Pseudomonadota bacterium]
MFNSAEKIFAGVLLIVSFIVALVGYSFSRTPSPPPRVWLGASGGDIIFDHTYHTELAKCIDCHHNYEEGKNSLVEMNCRSCHYFGEAREMKGDDPTHPRFMGSNCVACHKSQDMDIGCNTCHIRQGFAFEKSGHVRPSLPDNVKFDTDNGLVTFNHKLHISEDVGETCVGCHHRCKGGSDMKGLECRKSCRDCHHKKTPQIKESDDEYHKRYIGINCTNCHDAEKCESCHKE